MGQVMDEFLALTFGNLAASVHTFRILTNRGLVSPNEVENFFRDVAETMRDGSPKAAESFENRFQEQFAELRQIAQVRWIGTGHPDPEKGPSGRA